MQIVNFRCRLLFRYKEYSTCSSILNLVPMRQLGRLRILNLVRCTKFSTAALRCLMAHAAQSDLPASTLRSSDLQSEKTSVSKRQVKRGCSIRRKYSTLNAFAAESGEAIVSGWLTTSISTSGYCVDEFSHGRHSNSRHWSDARARYPPQMCPIPDATTSCS